MSTIAAKVKPEFSRRIREVAAQNGITLSELIRLSLQAYVFELKWGFRK